MEEAASDIARRVETFVRDVVAPYERDPRCGGHGPSDDLVDELKDLARAAGVLTPHICADGSHLSQRDTATVLKATGLSPLGPLACNTAAPDEGSSARSPAPSRRLASSTRSSRGGRDRRSS